MLVDLNRYLTRKEYIQKIFTDRKDLTFEKGIGIAAVATHVPVIVCAFYLGELLNWPQNAIDSIERLKKSYNYTEIKGIPDSYPGSK
jgi:hypothetical protein